MTLTRDGESRKLLTLGKQMWCYYMRQSSLRLPFIKTKNKWQYQKAIHCPSMGTSNGLVVLWNPKVIQGQCLQHDSNFQMIKCLCFHTTFTLINVYGPTQTQYKKRLWDALIRIIQQQVDQYLILVGEFKPIIDSLEKFGDIAPPIKTMQDLVSFVLENSLHDVLEKYGSYTWTNKRVGFTQIAKRLDQFRVSQMWNLESFSFELDHFSIQLTISKSLVVSDCTHRPSFKFKRMWFRHPQFDTLLRHWCESFPKVKGTKMFQFATELKQIKAQIREWNSKVFENVFLEKERVKKNIIRRK